MSCDSKTCNWIKVGDTVKIVDRSWATVYSGGNITSYKILPSDWRVVATGLVLPAESDIPTDLSPNDTIIWNSLNGMTVFIRHHFLQPINVRFIKCRECGARVRVD